MNTFRPQLDAYLRSLLQEDMSFAEDRKAILQDLAGFMSHKLQSGQPADMIFICTHNSRRSHFAQVWAQILAVYFGFDQVRSYSGGTEATAAHPNTLRALGRAGFEVIPLNDGPNPRQKIVYGTQGESFEIWSKRYDDPANPQAGFCAVMTCNEADEACPVVFGAAERISLPFEDPKVSDGTPEEEHIYSERCKQIATELAYAFSQVKKSNV